MAAATKRFVGYSGSNGRGIEDLRASLTPQSLQQGLGGIICLQWGISKEVTLDAPAWLCGTGQFIHFRKPVGQFKSAKSDT